VPPTAAISRATMGVSTIAIGSGRTGSGAPA